MRPVGFGSPARRRRARRADGSAEAAGGV